VTARPEPAGPATLLPEAVAGLALHVSPKRGSIVRPLVYGYIRLATTDAPDRCACLTRELASYAEREGMALAEVFTDRDTGSSTEAGRAGFVVMVQALRRPGVYGVLVPSLRHFSRFPGVHKAMCALIEVQTGARVLPIDASLGSPP
jgi:hypothetical protein